MSAQMPPRLPPSPVSVAGWARVIAESGDPVAGLRELRAGAAPPGVSPGMIAEAIRALLLPALRRGPEGEGPSPGRFLEIAVALAGEGFVPLALPGELRVRLDRLARETRSAGCWRPDVPFWWEPLPPPGPSEALWGEVAGALVVAQRSDREPHDLPAGSALLPELLPAPLVARAHGELESAAASGALDLLPGAVGERGRGAGGRSDAVRLVSGFEPDLLATAPTVAALVQGFRAVLPERIGALFPGAPVHPPQRAMLARYPAPSAGFAAHLDNPGGREDNGRVVTLVAYLNDPERPPAGGEIALWEPGSPGDAAPAAVLPIRGGSAVAFRSREVPHEVRPLRAGPGRWALSLWLNEKPQLEGGAPGRSEVPEPTPTDALLAVAEPPLPPGRVLFHDLGAGAGEGGDRTGVGAIGAHAIVVERNRPRAGIVATVYRAPDLSAWCRHHLAAGFAHLVVVFDRFEEERAAAEALAAEIEGAFGPDRLTIWPGDEAARFWPGGPGGPSGPAGPEHEDLRRWAGAGQAREGKPGGATWAVAARQTLNAGAALAAARGDELGGAPLDWLVHLDADELFYVHGPGRGGASAPDHFAAAAAAGLARVRYLNHELLTVAGDGESAGPSHFKLNPRLAAARLGERGWESVAACLDGGRGRRQDGPHPYFAAYVNGKSAVAVGAGAGAAGVHGWTLAGAPRGEEAAARETLLAGPSILHFHSVSPEAFRAKYRAAAEAFASGSPEAADRPFPPSALETAAVREICELQAAGVGEEAIDRRLDALREAVIALSPADAELLAAAGLLLTPTLEHPLRPPVG